MTAIFRSVVAWAREEYRLMRLKSWEAEYNIPEPRPCTTECPRVQHTLKRLELARKAMRRRKQPTLLDGKAWTSSAHRMKAIS